MNAGTTDIDQDEAAEGGMLTDREIARLAFAVNDSYYDLLGVHYGDEGDDMSCPTSFRSQLSRPKALPRLTTWSPRRQECTRGGSPTASCLQDSLDMQTSCRLPLTVADHGCGDFSLVGHLPDGAGPPLQCQSRCST
jgi:hypothetical protein